MTITRILILLSILSFSCTDNDPEPTYDFIPRLEESNSCEHGGQELHFGRDINQNDSLEGDEVDNSFSFCNTAEDEFLIEIKEIEAGSCTEGKLVINMAYDFNNNQIIDQEDFPSAYRFCKEDYQSDLLMEYKTYEVVDHCWQLMDIILVGHDLNNNDRIDSTEVIGKVELITRAAIEVNVYLELSDMDYEAIATKYKSNNTVGAESMALYHNFDMTLWSEDEIFEAIATQLASTIQIEQCNYYHVEYKTWEPGNGTRVMVLVYDSETESLELAG